MPQSGETRVDYGFESDASIQIGTVTGRRMA